jgi:hypothetical protein
MLLGRKRVFKSLYKLDQYSKITKKYNAIMRFVILVWVVVSGEW